MFRAIRGSIVFYPSDAVSCDKAVELAANTEGICFIRTGRPAAPVIYEPNEHFAIGQGKVRTVFFCVHFYLLQRSDLFVFLLQVCLTAGPDGKDHVTVVAAGVTLFEALKAAEELKKEGVSLRIIDPFTVKPIDAELIAKSVKDTEGRVLTVEDHAPEGRQ